MNSRSTRRTVLAGGVIALALIVSACSSPKDKAAAGSKADAKSTSYDAMTVAQLAAKAATEGKFVTYNSTPADTSAELTRALSSAYPKVATKNVRLDSASIPTRVFVEQKAGKYLGDVAGADGVYMTELRLGNATAPYTPPTKVATPKGISLPAGYQTIDSVETTVAAYNPTILKQHNLAAPTDWADFAKPAWKGHFSVDPDAVNWYTGLIAEYGHDKALALVKKIGDNDPIPVSSHSQALVQLEAGQAWATATSYGYLAAIYAKKDPTHVAFQNFKPLITTPNMVYLLKNAPHPAAARLYINWDLSKAGQQAMVDIVGLNSLRTDVTQDPKVWDPANFPPVFADPNLTTKQLTQYQQEYASALHVSS